MRAPARLARLQGHADSLMVDTCEVTRRTVGDVDETTGTTRVTDALVYAGPCRVLSPNQDVPVVSASGVITAEHPLEVQVPAVVVGIQVGDRVDVVSERLCWQGRTLVVVAVPSSTLSAVRRLVCRDSDARGEA